MGTNGVGHRTRMDDSSGFTTWSYDARGRVIEVYQSVTGGGNFRTQWGYNSADLPVWMRYPLDNGGNLGETVNFTYNTQMLLDRVFGTDTYVDDTWYDAAGRVTLRELGNNYTLGQTYTYYPWTQQGGRLQNLKSGIALDTDSLQSLSYVYDDVGNVQSITDTNAGGTQTQTFTYDALDRLSSAVASGGTGGTYSLQNYDYDTQGRLEINGTVTNYYENTAHIHAVSKTSTGNTYSYDQNGNQTSRKVGGITYTLIYDTESRLVQVKRGSNIQATYNYDGDGNRVKTVVGSTTTTYIGNYLERECINSACAMKSYYYAAGQRVALRKGDGTLYFLLTDHLGSTAITATSSGGRDAELRYYPWGGTRYTYGTTPTSYRYTGQREAEVGLYYYGARYYDPQLGRFASPDSIIPNPGDPVSYDRFGYVRNNPLKYIDPSGHNPECGPDGIYCDSQGQLLNNADLYDSLVDSGFFSMMPDPSDIYNSSWNTMSRITRVLTNYEQARRALFIRFGLEAVDISGKIHDDVLMALFVAVEFGSDIDDFVLYAQGKEALSNQYFGETKTNRGPMQCLGNCTLLEQLLWATQMEGFYGNANFVDEYIDNDAWTQHWEAGMQAAAGYSYGEDTSWFWGNVSEADLSRYEYTIIRQNYEYPGKPYFIIYDYENP